MGRQSILRNFDTIHQSGFDHPPTDKALKAAQSQNRNKPGFQVGAELSAQPEPHHWHQQSEAEKTPQQTMAPFPQKNSFEAVERHPRIHFGILRDLLIFVEGLSPVSGAQRWQSPAHRFPFGNRKAGLGKPRGSAHNHHSENQPCHYPQPQPNRQGRGCERSALVCGANLVDRSRGRKAELGHDRL